MLSIAAGLSRDAYERVCQIFFERFNAAGFAILERPMIQFYATISGTLLSGVVVDIDQSGECSPCFRCAPPLSPPLRARLGCGTRPRPSQLPQTASRRQPSERPVRGFPLPPSAAQQLPGGAAAALR